MQKLIGADLRRARTRREIELSEVEAATKIRGRFLRAIEAEDWEALPGGVYTRGFIRAYAAFLGLDGERLAADYRRDVEGEAAGPPHEPAPPAESAAVGSSRGRRPTPRLAWLALAAVLGVAAVAIAVLPGGGGGGGVAGPASPRAPRGEEPRSGAPPAKAPPRRGVELRLTAAAEVWVCLLDGRGRPLVGGLVLEPGAEAGPFRSGSFTVSLGNGEVSMLVNGERADIPATASPLGYSIDAAGTLVRLAESDRPTCT